MKEGERAEVEIDHKHSYKLSLNTIIQFVKSFFWFCHKNWPSLYGLLRVVQQVSYTKFWWLLSVKVSRSIEIFEGQYIIFIFTEFCEELTRSFALFRILLQHATEGKVKIFAVVFCNFTHQVLFLVTAKR